MRDCLFRNVIQNDAQASLCRDLGYPCTHLSRTDNPDRAYAHPPTPISDP
jgi:hypothetical protein